jgi:hypothetical protein
MRTGNHSSKRTYMSQVSKLSISAKETPLESQTDHSTEKYRPSSTDPELRNLLSCSSGREKIVDVRPTGIPLMCRVVCSSRRLVFHLQCNRQRLDRRLETQAMGTFPAVGSSDADARPILRAEVKMAQNLFLEGEGVLMDCTALLTGAYSNCEITSAYREL